MDREKVLNLAKLARIKLSDSEAENLSKDLELILGYVAEVKEISTDNRQLTTDNFPNKNVMREDGEPHESGVYTERLLKEAPARSGNYIMVKKIL
jgi:aspartyl-tRNA(Asn)/glutamyl-tRNA(Gln) amidotransferase subunit C